MCTTRVSVRDYSWYDLLTGKMKLSKDEIMEAIDNDDWQRLRISLKGRSTHDKLLFCRLYLNRVKGVPEMEEAEARKYYVRVVNYINALKRGGQLDIEGNIQR